jgi:hypothetical protein
MIHDIKENNPYSQKIWLKSYDDHVKPEYEVEFYSVAEMFRRSVQKYPDSLCYDFQASEETKADILSYAQDN